MSIVNMALNIRPAKTGDHPAIIDLLRRSLGESTTPKSEQLWSWKHLQNPFGESYVLIAEEEGRIVGVRAFMQWQFQRRGKVYRALRAVDTVTHPDYMGKGIFKKLTLQLAEKCKQDGFHFIFNTPNTQSKPGYLKMGWVEQGKLPIKFKFLHPVRIASKRFLKKNNSIDNAEKKSPVQKWTNASYDLVSDYFFNENLLNTVLSPDYISWRYANNPLFSYNYITDMQNVLLISRIKDTGFGKELRIVDFVLLNESSDYSEANEFLKTEVRKFCKANAIDFISLSGAQFKENKKYFRWMGIMPVINAGPMVTLRDLNMKAGFGRLMNKKYWGYSIGDLELF